MTARRTQSPKSKRHPLKRSLTPLAPPMRDRKRKGLQGTAETASAATCLFHGSRKCVYRQVVSIMQQHSACRFMIGSSDSDSEDDKRVIRSAKDRRFDELQATCHEIRVCKPITNFKVCKQWLLLLVIGLCTLVKTELACWLSLYFKLLQNHVNINDWSSAYLS